MIISDSDINAFFVTIKLATITTTFLLLLGTPLAWWLARSKWRFKFLLEAVIALPLILPPTVIGFYLLIILGAGSPIGTIIKSLGLEPLVFNFSGLVIGSIIYSMPFVVQPLQNSFTAISDKTIELAIALGASPIDRFITVVMPLAKTGFITATVLGFAHTVGEFGIVLMIGGNIPEKTQVISIAIYDHVEGLEYANAHLLSIILLVTSFIMLASIYAISHRFKALKI